MFPECSADCWEVMTPDAETAQVYARLFSFSYLSLMLFASLFLLRLGGW